MSARSSCSEHQLIPLTFARSAPRRLLRKEHSQCSFLRPIDKFGVSWRIMEIIIARPCRSHDITRIHCCAVVHSRSSASSRFSGCKVRSWPAWSWPAAPAAQATTAQLPPITTPPKRPKKCQRIATTTWITVAPRFGHARFHAATPPNRTRSTQTCSSLRRSSSCRP